MEEERGSWLVVAEEEEVGQLIQCKRRGRGAQLVGKEEKDFSLV